jgi:hypothetical protein
MQEPDFMECWRETLLMALPASAFHCGRVEGSKGGFFRANLDWFLRPEKAVKLHQNWEAMRRRSVNRSAVRETDYQNGVKI